MSKEPVLVVEDYGFWFKPATGSPEGPPALIDVAFEIQPGSFVLILGNSGSGKSTLALNLVGIYPSYFGGRNQGQILVNHPDHGIINRREFPATERFRLINMLFQNPEDQIVTLTVEEEIGFALENYLFEPSEIHRRIDYALDLVELTGFRHRETLYLSGGEKQRVALAAMLALEPTVLILDEPTSNLDPAGTANVLATIDRVREQTGLTIMVIEHEVDEIFSRVDHVLLVEEQGITGPLTPREFIDKRGLFVRDNMGLWIPQAAEVGLDLRAQGIDLGSNVPLSGSELVSMLDNIGINLPLAPPSKNREVTAKYLTLVDTSHEVVIDAKDVSFSYDDHQVLNGANITVCRNELLAVVGQNGSGKSTLASMLNGVTTPDSGTVLVDGVATNDHDFVQLVKRVAYIFQVPEKQFVCGTVYDEIAHGLRALSLSEAEVDERTIELLETVRLLDRREASPYVLSHGQKRRLSVAAMVVSKPEVVVLDEPTFGQDYYQAQNLMRLLRNLADEGAAVVFITHDMRLVAEYADRTAVLCNGEIIFDGPPEKMFGDEAVLTRARLRPPAVYEFSAQILGKPVLTTEALSKRIRETQNG